jgi:hypothetical protein
MTVVPPFWQPNDVIGLRTTVNFQRSEGQPLATIPQLVALAVSIGSSWLVVGQLRSAMIAGALVYLGYSYGSRAFLLRHHQSGMRAMHAGRYDEGSRHFEASYLFLQRHAWIDRFRSVVLMSAAASTYREMALINSAFAHLQLGHLAEARSGYERALREFPTSSLAAAGLEQSSAGGK